MNNYDWSSGYSAWSNKTTLTLDFRGLGLPRDSYFAFENLLAIASSSDSTCFNKKGGYCLLAKSCESYTESGLWEYDFKV